MMDRHGDTFSDHRRACSLGLLLGWGRVVASPLAAPSGTHFQRIYAHRCLGETACQSQALIANLPEIRAGALACPSRVAGNGATRCHGSGQPPGSGLVHAAGGRRRLVGLQGRGDGGAATGGARGGRRCLLPEGHRCGQGAPAQSRAGAGRCGRLLDPDRDREQDAALMPVPVGIGKGVGNVLR
jgi:hypothetical protein